MKQKWIYKISIALLSIIMLIGSVAPVTVSAATPYVKKLSVVSDSTVVLSVGEKSNIKAKVSVSGSETKKLYYISADKTVAKVSSKGVITAVAEGTTHITVKRSRLSQARETFICELVKKVLL